MTIRTLWLSLGLALALGGSTGLAAEEDPSSHAKHVTHTIVFDGTDIRPSTTQMSQDDVLAFENYSTQPVELTFTEPADLRKKIRCGLVHEKDAPESAPWALFTWQGDKLVASLPPGRFASICALAPGSYAYTASVAGQSPRSGAGGSLLPNKGQVVVK